jgi:hypothetical protein
VKRFVIMAAAVLALFGAASPVWAQGRLVRLDGLVQWIAGDKMMLILDNGRSVAVELAQVPQDQYRALTQRDRVTVEGTVSPDNRRVFARAVIRDSYSTESP